MSKDNKEDAEIRGYDPLGKPSRYTIGVIATLLAIAPIIKAYNAGREGIEAVVNAVETMQVQEARQEALDSRYEQIMGLELAATEPPVKQLQQAPEAQPIPKKNTENRHRSSNDSVYLVKANDTFGEIGGKFGIDYKEIMQWNNITDPRKLQAGQLLTLNPEVDASNFQIYLDAAYVLYAEAANQPDDAVMLVARVTKNRAEDPRYASSLRGAIKQRNAFSSVIRGGSNQYNKARGKQAKTKYEWERMQNMLRISTEVNLHNKKVGVPNEDKLIAFHDDSVDYSTLCAKDSYWKTLEPVCKKGDVVFYKHK